MWSFFEAKNHSKAVIRLGEQDHGTCQHEKLLLLNSYAKTVGYKDNQVPFKDLSAPTAETIHRENMGFTYVTPQLDRVTNPTDGSGDVLTSVVDDDGTNDEEENNAEDALHELFGEDFVRR